MLLIFVLPPLFRKTFKTHCHFTLLFLPRPCDVDQRVLRSPGIGRILCGTLAVAKFQALAGSKPEQWEKRVKCE